MARLGELLNFVVNYIFVVYYIVDVFHVERSGNNCSDAV